MVETLVFYSVAIISIVAAVAMITSKKAISSAVNLILIMFLLAVLFVLQQAELVAAIQVLVYAGAIMVLFVFVIMLLNADEKSGSLALNIPAIQIAIAILITFSLSFVIGFYEPDKLLDGAAAVGNDFGTATALGRLLYTENILPFEIVSILLLVALVGAVMLTKRKLR
ncbi:MAG: NADH-quinone oxidoreductase subunit J [Nitrospinota bacterium]